MMDELYEANTEIIAWIQEDGVYGNWLKARVAAGTSRKQLFQLMVNPNPTTHCISVYRHH